MGYVRRIVIVGGGITGLSAAWELVSRWRGDVDVTVLDGADRVGGKLRREVIGGRLVDVGAESMLATRPEAVDLITEIGAADLLVTPATSSASVLSRGRLHPLPRGTLMGIPGDAADARGILDEAEEARARDEWPHPRLDSDVSVGDFVGAALGPAVVDRLVEPLLGGVYAGHAASLSLAATMPTVYAAASRARPLLDLVAEHRQAVLSGTGASPFVGIRGGVGHLPGLVEQAIRDAGGAVRSHQMVRAVESTGSAWHVTSGPVPDARVTECDGVILATPAAATRRLLGPLAPSAGEALSEIETASVALVTFAFPTTGTPELSGSGFLVPPIEGLAIKAATFSSQKWGWLADAARTVRYVRVSLGRHGDEADLQQHDDDLADLALRELGQVTGLSFPAPLDIHVQRWGGGLPQYAVGHLTRVARIRAAMSALPRLEVAGAAYTGVGIPAVIASGREAARALATDLGLRD